MEKNDSLLYNALEEIMIGATGRLQKDEYWDIIYRMKKDGRVLEDVLQILIDTRQEDDYFMTLLKIQYAVYVTKK